MTVSTTRTTVQMTMKALRHPWICIQQVTLSLLTEFENFSVFKPGDYNVGTLNTLLDQVIARSTALAPLRQRAAAPVAGPVSKRDTWRRLLAELSSMFAQFSQSLRPPGWPGGVALLLPG